MIYIYFPHKKQLGKEIAIATWNRSWIEIVSDPETNFEAEIIVQIWTTVFRIDNDFLYLSFSE